MFSWRTKKIFFVFLILAAAVGFWFFVPNVFAQPDLGLTQIQDDIGLPATDIRTIAANIIRVALGLLGIVALCLILYGGYVWMTAGGDEERIGQAKKILVNSVIGLIIILSAYAIVSFVISKLLSATTGLPEHCFNQQQDSGESGIDCGGECPACGGGGGGGAGNVFYVMGKPASDLGCGSRNVKPTVFFNQSVNLETIPGNLVLREKESGQAVAGAWSYLAVNRQNAAQFTPNGDCGDGGPAECLAADTAYELVFVKASAIKSQNNLVLNCLLGAKCEPAAAFSTGAGIDRTPPTVRINAPSDGSRLPQGQVVPISASFSDDYGLQNISLYVSDNYISGQTMSGCQKSGQVFFNWPTAGFATGTYRLDMVALDGGNTGIGTANVLLLPGHCFDNDKNDGEIEAGPPACGDGCGSCAGQTCDSDADCASGYCEIPAGQTEGICVDRTQITSVTPISGAAATIVSVIGKFFGDEPGRAYFTNKTGGWVQALLVNCASSFDSWTPSQIVVEVPADAADGPLKVETAPIVGPDGKSRRFVDVTNDDWGELKNFSFDVNELKRPGLCAIVPSSGQPFSEVTFIGRNFYPVYDPDRQVFEFDTTVAAVLPLSWKVEPFTGLSSAVVKVPYLPKGIVAAKTIVGGIESNGLRFGIGVVSDESRPMVFNVMPEEGARGEYITITGRNFGSIRGQVLFKKDGKGEDVYYGSFDFPEDCKTSVWNDSRVIVKFPSLASRDDLNGQYSVQVVRVENNTRILSPIGVFFTLKNGQPAPGICRLEPSAAPIPLPNGTNFEISGEYFLGAPAALVAYFWQNGADASTSTVIGRIAAPTLEVDRTNNKEKIISGSPSAVDTGPVVVTREDGRVSNPLNFAVYNCLNNNSSCAGYPGTTCCPSGPEAGQCRQSCEAGQRATGYLWRFSTRDFQITPQVIERCDSKTESGQAVPSPAPSSQWVKDGNTDSNNVCRTAVVTVAFNVKLNSATINKNNFKIYKCAESATTGNNCAHAGNAIDLADSSYVLNAASWGWASGEFYLLASPKNNGGQWENNTWYQVVLSKNITGYGTGLSLKSSRPCASDSDSAYCFVFRTDDRVCRLRKVVVTPLDYWTSVLEKPIRHRQDPNNADDPGEKLNWLGNGLSDQRCIWLNMSDYRWSWNVDDTTRAEVFSADGNAAQISALSNTVGVGLANDAVQVKATASRPLPGSSIALDISGRDNDAVLGAGTFIDENGIIGQAVGFDGTGAGVNASSNLALNKSDFEFGTGPFTVVAWVKTDSFKAGAVFSKPTVWTTAGKGWGVAWAGSPELLYLNIGDGSVYKLYRFDDSNLFLPPNNSRVLSSWTQIGMARSVDGLIYLIKDGQIKNTGIIFKGDASNSAADLLLGKQGYTGHVIDGSIDDARVYRRALSQTEITNLYAYRGVGDDGVSENNLVGHWTFDRKDIGGDTESQTGQSPLHIDLSKPRVVDYWPNCLEACPNAAVGARFNILMANGNQGLSGYNLNQAVHLFRCFDENCVSTAPVNIGPTFSPADRRQLDFVAGELAVNTLYKVVLSANGTSTANGMLQLWSSNSKTVDYIAGRPMQTEFTWRFRTKAQDCVMDRVAVSPSVFQAKHYDDRAVFSAEPYSAPDACEPNGQRLDPWSVDWRWGSSDEKVATIQPFITKGQNNFCTANCLKKGSAIAYNAIPNEPLCGNGLVEAGEDCDQPGKNLGCGLNCLALGNTTTAPATEGGQYCGDNIVQKNLGETCDPPSAANGCGTTCLRTGSKNAPAPGEVNASICGNAMIGLGEDCDLGVLPSRILTTSSLFCSTKCLHLGSALSASWCQANAANFGGFDRPVFAAACAKAISRCGDAVVGPDEDRECECDAAAGGVGGECAPKWDPKICSVNCLLLGKKCEPYETVIIHEQTVTRRREGCGENGLPLGSSLFYSAPSVCGDGVVGIGEEVSCERDFLVNNSFVNPWALAIGVGKGVVGGEPPAQRTNIAATGIKDNRSQTGQGVFELTCGYKTDADCLAADKCGQGQCGVANDTCCYSRPQLISAYPEKITPPQFNVCPNTEIKLVFDKKIDPNTLRGNLIIAQGNSAAITSCPVGDNVTHLVEPAGSGASEDMAWYRRLWDKAVTWFKDVLSLKSAAALKEAVNSDLWCAGGVTGVPEIVVADLSPDSNTTSTIYVRLQKPLATSTDYAVILRPGLRDIKGVSVGDKIQWKFITADQICELSALNIIPSEKTFRVAGESADFSVESKAKNGRLIQPVDGYRWEYTWQPMTNDFVSLTDTTSSVNQVKAKNRNGELDLLAENKFTENIYFAASPALTARARLIVYLCERPWPSIGSWPFHDAEYDFTFHYCLDAGGTGPADDLPDLKIARQDRLAAENYLRRYFLTTPENPDAIGVQIFPNGGHLSIEDWYRAQGFGGSFQRLKIDGYEAISDGNNVYIDALNYNQNFSIDPPTEKFYSNIYLFSLSGGASAELRSVFDQLLSNLKFNSNLENAVYCGSQFSPPNPDFNFPCVSDLDCAAAPIMNDAYPFCLNQKDKVQRNYRRLKDLRFLADALDAYGAAKQAAGSLSYPLIKNNTFLTNQAFSVWTSSWQELSSALTMTAPTDPINRLGPAGTCFTDAKKTCQKDADCASVPTGGRSSFWLADSSLADELSASTTLIQHGSLGYSAGKGHGQAFDLTGEAGAYLAVDDSKYNQASMTVSLWFYPRKRNTSVLIQKGGPNGDGIGRGGWQVEYSGWSYAGPTPLFNNGTLRFAVFATGTKKYYAVDTAAPLTLNQWHHLAVRFKAGAGAGNEKLYLYLDGEAVNNPVKNETGAVVTDFSGIIMADSAEPLVIGQNFNGLIDNVAFYNQSLVVAQVEKLYQGLCIIHDATTGWSAEDRRFSFVCNPDSLAYRYVAGTDADISYKLRAKSEKTDLPAWETLANEFFGDRYGDSVFMDSLCLEDNEIASPYSVICGDGLLGQDEDCDPPGKTSYDLSACPAAGKVAKKQTCDASCAWGSETLISCKQAVAESLGVDKKYLCGDGKVQAAAGEKCDDGKLNGQKGRCNSECSRVLSDCQNQVIDSGELCDPTHVPSDPAIAKGNKRGWCIGGPYYFDLKNGSSYLPCNSNSDCMTGNCHIADDLYGLVSGYSCGWDCQSRGPSCGDGVVEGEWGEQCEGNESCTIGGKSGRKKCALCRYDNTDIEGLISLWGFDYINESGWIYDTKAAAGYVSGECVVHVTNKGTINVCPNIVSGKHEGNMGFDFAGNKALIVDDKTVKYFNESFTTEAWVKPANVTHGNAERIWEKGGMQGNISALAKYRGGFGLEFVRVPSQEDCKQQTWNGASVDCDNIQSSDFANNFRCLTWIPNDSAYAKANNQWGFFPADTFGVSLDEWHHIDCVFEGTPVVDADRPDVKMYAGVLKAYVDGKLVATNNYARMASTTAPICFGRRCVPHNNFTEFWIEDGGPTPFNGAIEDVAYYNRALSADELKQHYNGDGWYCSAFAPVTPQTGCGNHKVEEDEACDTGVLNGLPCVPVNKSCSYCSADCRNILTVDVICGNGVVQYPLETCDTKDPLTGIPRRWPYFDKDSELYVDMCYTCSPLCRGDWAGWNILIPGYEKNYVGACNAAGRGFCGDGIKNGWEQCDSNGGDCSVKKGISLMEGTCRPLQCVCENLQGIIITPEEENNGVYPIN